MLGMYQSIQLHLQHRLIIQSKPGELMEPDQRRALFECGKVRSQQTTDSISMFITLKFVWLFSCRMGCIGRATISRLALRASHLVVQRTDRYLIDRFD